MEKKLLDRRQFLKMAALAGGAAVLAACTPPATETPKATEAPKVEEPTTAPVAQEPVEMEFWNQMSSKANREIFPKVIDDFMVMYPNIKVKYEISGGPPGGGNFIEVIMAHVAAGNPPDTAMFWSAATQFAAKGVLYPIDEYMTTAKYGGFGKWVEMPFASCQWQGKTYALPTSAANGAYYMNGVWFDQLGVSKKRVDFPTSWEALKDLAAKFNVVENGEIKKVGLVPWGNGWYDQPAWLQSNGGGIFDVKNLKYTIDLEQNIQVIDFWVKWLDDQFLGDVEKVNMLGGHSIYPDTAWWLGKEAITTDGAWTVTNNGELPVKDNYEIAKYTIGPSGKKSITPWGPNWEVVLKGAKHPYEGFLFNEYFCTIGWTRWYKEGCPEVPAWVDAPKDMYNVVFAQLVGLERAKEMEAWNRAYLNEAAASMWDSPIEDYTADLMNSAIDEALHKTKSAAQALQDTQKLCQDKLEEVLAGKF